MMRVLDLSDQRGLSLPFHNPQVRAVRTAGSVSFLPEIFPGLHKKPTSSLCGSASMKIQTQKQTPEAYNRNNLLSK